MTLLAAIDFSLPLRDPVAVFAVVLLVLLAAPLVGRRGLPSSVVLLVAGVALGPNALGVLDRDPTIVLLGTVGLLYIMFLAGLEIDLHEFARHRRRSLVLTKRRRPSSSHASPDRSAPSAGSSWPFHPLRRSNGDSRRPPCS